VRHKNKAANKNAYINYKARRKHVSFLRAFKVNLKFILGGGVSATVFVV